jgi:ankyrin repeat protein
MYKNKAIMKKVLLATMISFAILSCSHSRYQLGMEDSIASLSEQETSSEDETSYASPLDQFLDLLEWDTEKKQIAFLKQTLAEDPNALKNLYPSSDDEKKGLIHYAAAKGSLKLIELLVSCSEDKNAIVNLKSAENVTPLHLAALRGNPTIVSYFIEQGADPNAKDLDEGNTVLHYAVKKLANVDVVELLLKKGARIEETIDPEDGSTLLHWAVQYDNTLVVEYLLEYYAAHCPELIDKKTINPSLTAHELAKRLNRWNIITAFEEFKKEECKQEEFK